ncbi:YlxR family protein [Nakamurella flavida]|uniref:YlxR family protein n=1 Tax=Nakamurella flavida TaxID=363630 RepID=UPI0031D38CC8
MGCRKREAADDLLRVVVADGNLVPDLRQRLPGRGAWLHPARRCYDLAEHRRAFGRALKVSVPLDSSRVRSLLPEEDGGPRTPPAKGGGRRSSESRSTVVSKP